MSNLPPEVLDRINSALSDTGVSVEDLAYALNRTLPEVRSILSGDVPISSLTIAVVADQTRTNIDYLLTGRDFFGLIGPCRMPDDV